MYTQQQGTQKRPIAAAVLAIIAGVIGLIMAILSIVGVLWIMSLFESEYYGVDVTGLIAMTLGIAIWILIASILVLYGGKQAYSRPAEHTKWGVVILLFSITGLGLFFLSIGTDWTGILGAVAAIMGIIGGILALVFKPAPTPYGQQQPYAQTGYPPPPPQTSSQQPYAAQQQIKRICPQCGRVVDENIKFCPNCGKSLA